MGNFRTLTFGVFVLALIVLWGTLVSGAQPLLDQPTINNGPILGEELEYSIRVRGIPAGTQIIRVKSNESLNGREVYHVESRSKANKIFYLLYPFDDRSESFIAKEGFHPLRYRRELIDGAYRGAIAVDFDDAERKASIVKDRKRRELRVPKGVQDELSMIYLLRTKDIQVGEEYEFPAIVGTKFFRVGVKVIRIEDLKTIFGTIKTIVVKSVPRDITLWVTHDEARIPVRLEMDTKIGKVVAELKRTN